MQRKYWIALIVVVLCLITTSAAMLVSTFYTEGSTLWVVVQAKNKNYHPTVLTVPTPTLPSPNGFDTFVLAGKALRDIPGIDNAYKTRGQHLACEQKLLTENTRALALFQTGLTQTYLHPPIRSSGTLLPHLSQWRTLERLLALDVRAKAAHGDWNGAAQRSLEMIQFGIIIPRGGHFIVSLVGIALQHIGYAELWPCVDHLSALQARDAMRRLEQIETRQVPCADMLREEMIFGYAVMKKELLVPSRKKSISQQRLDRRCSEILLGLYVNCMQESIADARLPYSQQPPSPTPKGLYAKIMALDLRKVSVKISANQSHEELLILALALRAYALEHTQYPTSLNALVPNYLASLPNDPFTRRGSYCYKPRGTTYLLYSIGPDGRDDGGQPLKNPRGKDGKPGSLSDVSTGDILADAVK